MLHLAPHLTAIILLALITPICLWVIWTDLKFMKIRNEASLTLLGIFVVAGLLLLPLDVWLWRWPNLAIVLIVGLGLNMAAHFGMGDVKFAAAAAPFFGSALPSVELALILLCAMTILCFAAHRIARAIPAVRRATPDWESWKRRDFPFGIVLAATLWVYYLLVTLAS